MLKSCNTVKSQIYKCVNENQLSIYMALAGNVKQKLLSHFKKATTNKIFDICLVSDAVLAEVNCRRLNAINRSKISFLRFNCGSIKVNGSIPIVLTGARISPIVGVSTRML